MFTFESLQVHPLDTTKLEEYFNSTYRYQDDPLSIPKDIGVIVQPELGILYGWDVVYVPSKDQHEIIFPAYNATKMELFPKCTIGINKLEFHIYLKDPVTVAEFTKERRGYNYRIQCNERIICAHFNQHYKS